MKVSVLNIGASDVEASEDLTHPTQLLICVERGSLCSGNIGFIIWFHFHWKEGAFETLLLKKVTAARFLLLFCQNTNT